jgi:hypothetical protein
MLGLSGYWLNPTLLPWPSLRGGQAATRPADQPRPLISFDTMCQSALCLADQPLLLDDPLQSLPAQLPKLTQLGLTHD